MLKFKRQLRVFPIEGALRVALKKGRIVYVVGSRSLVGEEVRKVRVGFREKPRIKGVVIIDEGLLRLPPDALRYGFYSTMLPP